MDDGSMYPEELILLNGWQGGVINPAFALPGKRLACAQPKTNAGLSKPTMMEG